MSSTVNNLLRNVTFALLCFSVVGIDSARAARKPPRSAAIRTESLLDRYQGLYRAPDTKAGAAFIHEVFDEAYAHVVRHQTLFTKTLRDITRNNDAVDLRPILQRPDLPADSRLRMQLTIRLLARAIYCMGEHPHGADYVAHLYERTLALPYERRVHYYFTCEAYRALAKRTPAQLLAAIEAKTVGDPTMAALALLRQGRSIAPPLVRRLLARNERFAILLLHHLPWLQERERQRYLDKRLSAMGRWTALTRLSRERDVCNGLAAFAAGRRRLAELRQQGTIDYLKLQGCYFVVLPRTGLQRASLMPYVSALRESARLLNRARQAFESPESLAVVHVVPALIGPAKVPMGSAGWSADSLWISLQVLEERSPRAVAYTLLHEACEQQFMKGRFSRRLGELYLRAMRRTPTTVRQLRLGQRIGGSYVDDPLGHPWDGEREWLAEVAATVIAGDELPPGLAGVHDALSQLMRLPSP